MNTVVFDEIQVHPLKENGENIPVTFENKAEYVDLYVDFLLNKSVENQFNAFNQGFQKVYFCLYILFNLRHLSSAIKDMYNYLTLNILL